MTSQTCSWCHTSNVLNHYPTYCRCGHRADLPRLDCDCPTCRGPARSPAPPVDAVAELAAELRQTADWLEERATNVQQIGRRGRAGETLDQVALHEASKLRGRARLLRLRADIFAGPVPTPSEAT